MICGTDFSIIALIGVILLIGIVKKNAIMMIDFALVAEREDGLSSHDAIYRASVLRFRPIMATPPWPHEPWRAAVGDRFWRGVGAAPAAGHLDRFGGSWSARR